MFRAQSNIFDDVVVKSTDENLTSENWEYILVRVLSSVSGTLCTLCRRPAHSAGGQTRRRLRFTQTIRKYMLTDAF